MRTRIRPTEVATSGRVGDSAQRPDGVLKVTGQFAYSSDLWMDGMLWGATLRSPHPSARIRSIDIGPALAVPGVRAVLTHEDVPGTNAYGLDHADQPVLAVDVVRYQGEPVALVAADHPETARLAAERIAVDYEVLPPITDAMTALGHTDWNIASDQSAAPSTATDQPFAPNQQVVTDAGMRAEQAVVDARMRAEQAVTDARMRAEQATVPLVHPGGNLVRHVKIRKGDPEPRADVVVVGEYSVGMQDQAFLGPESGLAVPGEDGGVDLFVATQWLHVDQRQICAALGLGPDKVRLTLAGVGGAFGGREDLSMHIHACLLALHTGKPVKIVYNRTESFLGHVHRHPARMRYEHGVTRDGRIVYVRATIYLDGGAYASSTPAVVANAATMGIGPYDVPNVHVDCYGAYTNNPPCGAMRGFGTVQAAYAYEAQLDRIAAELGLDPVEVRCRNAMREGSQMSTNQIVDSPAPVAELLRKVEALPLPPPLDPTQVDLRELPGGVSNTTHGEGVRRGIGYAVAFKNVGFSEGFDDYSTARVRLDVSGGEPVVTVHTAAAEVGQGLVTVLQQIVRTELGVENVVLAPADTRIGNGGSTSASRQTYVTGGAVKAACELVRADVLAIAQRAFGRVVRDLRLVGGKVTSNVEGSIGSLADLLDGPVEHTVEWRHRPTVPLDPETGSGTAHVQYAFAAHRAVVDVDTELGLVKVVALDCVQDVGKAINPQAVRGQIYGGAVQGLGLALMEEIVVTDGVVRNASFTDYLIPTVLDVPPLRAEILEYADPHAPYGLRGVGEPPTISAGPAILAALRQATGLPLTRVPVQPEQLIGSHRRTADTPPSGARRHETAG